MFSLREAPAILLLVIVSASVLFAQTATGEISGIITDPNGAAVPVAVVRLTNEATKIATETKTNESALSESHPALSGILLETHSEARRFTTWISQCSRVSR
jgi:hypothetical protein